MSDQEVPEPDAVEQALPVADLPGMADPSSDPEAPEADALEQAIEEPVDEEEGRAEGRGARRWLAARFARPRHERAGRPRRR